MIFECGDKVRRINFKDEYPLDGSIVTIENVSAAGYFIKLKEGTSKDYFRSSSFELVKFSSWS